MGMRKHRILIFFNFGVFVAARRHISLAVPTIE